MFRFLQEYSSFALSLMLSQAGLRLVTFPEAPFRLNHWSSKGYQCIVDKTPDRKLDLQARGPLCSTDALNKPLGSSKMRCFQSHSASRPQRSVRSCSSKRSFHAFEVSRSDLCFSRKS